MTPEEKEERLQALSQRIREIQKILSLYNRAFARVIGEKSLCWPFPYRKRREIHGDEFVLSVDRTNRITRAEMIELHPFKLKENLEYETSDEYPLDFFINTEDPLTGNPTSRNVLMTVLEYWTPRKNEGELFDFTEEWLLEIARNIKGCYEKLLGSLSNDAQILARKLVEVTRNLEDEIARREEVHERVSGRYGDEMKKNTSLESSLANLMGEVNIAAESLGETRRFVKSSTIREIRERLQEANLSAAILNGGEEQEPVMWGTDSAAR